MSPSTPGSLDRRRLLAACAAAGLGGTLLPGVLLGMTSTPEPRSITADLIAHAARLAGVTIAPEQREAMVRTLASALDDFDAIRALKLDNSVPMSLGFDPVLPGTTLPDARHEHRWSRVDVGRAPDRIEDLAFASARELSEMVRTRRVSALALAEMSLERLKRLDPRLRCVVTLTEGRALAQAREADADLARGRWRGPLHGLPWGAKDLLSVRGYPTTWGAAGFETQSFGEEATVVRRLDEAGAVLVAKLTLGALAMGDRWFGGQTRNPWRLEQGSSGSSAGSAAAVAAGCVAFAIGSETLGSISSPSTRCGTTGLRPTFGKVPRTGAMALSWSMDKLGPLCRSAEDCAMVLAAIAGPDGHDRAVRDVPFSWDARRDLRTLRIGRLAPAFERVGRLSDADAKDPVKSRTAAWERATLSDAQLALEALGVELLDVELPELPYLPMIQMLLAEAAAAFDELTRSGRDAALTGQGPDDWPNLFRAARFIPAVEYVNASRARELACRQLGAVFEKVDVIVTPTETTQLVASNLTGHPAVIVPCGFRPDDEPAPAKEEDGGGPGTPWSLTFLGGLHREAELLRVAMAWQERTGWHRRHPAF